MDKKENHHGDEACADESWDVVALHDVQDVVVRHQALEVGIPQQERERLLIAPKRKLGEEIRASDKVSEKFLLVVELAKRRHHYLAG